jgi:hypothetical protein
VTAPTSPENTKPAILSVPRSPLVLRILGVLLAILAVFSIVMAGLSDKDYGTPAFWAAPSHINYCGREFHRNAGSVHGTPKYFVYLDRGAPTSWQRIGRTFALHPIYATVLDNPVPGKLCAGNLYIRASGTGNYIRYELSGGP